MLHFYMVWHEKGRIVIKKGNNMSHFHNILLISPAGREIQILTFYSEFNFSQLFRHACPLVRENVVLMLGSVNKYDKLVNCIIHKK